MERDCSEEHTRQTVDSFGKDNSENCKPERLYVLYMSDYVSFKQLTIVPYLLPLSQCIQRLAFCTLHLCVYIHSVFV